MRCKKVRDLQPGDVIDRAGETETVLAVRVDERWGHVHVTSDRFVSTYGIDDTETVR